MDYYGEVINKRQLASYLKRVLSSSCAKLLASKYTLSSQRKTEEKYGRILQRLDVTSTSNSSLIINGDLVRVANRLDKANKRRLNTMLYLVEIKRFSSSKAKGRNESALPTEGLVPAAALKAAGTCGAPTPLGK